MDAYHLLVSNLITSIIEQGVRPGDMVRTGNLLKSLGIEEGIDLDNHRNVGAPTLASRVETIRSYKVFYANDTLMPELAALISAVHPTLEVKQSTIEGAGMGLFTKKPIDVGSDTPITLYGGIRMSDNFYAANHMGSKGNYLVELPVERAGFIDGKTCFRLGYELGRWINHTDYINCQFYYTKEGVLEVRALKRIEAGEELFLNYGKEYFLGDCAFCGNAATYQCENCPTTLYCGEECQLNDAVTHICGKFRDWFRPKPPLEKGDMSVMFGTGEQMVPTIYLGSKSALNEFWHLGAIISVIDESELSISGRFSKNHAHLHIQAKESPNYNLSVWFDRVASWIDDQVRAKRHILIYSVDGKSSAVVLLMYYMFKYYSNNFKTLDDVLAYIKARRPQVDPSPAFMKQLRDFLATK